MRTNPIAAPTARTAIDLMNLSIYLKRLNLLLGDGAWDFQASSRSLSVGLFWVPRIIEEAYESGTVMFLGLKILFIMNLVAKRRYLTPMEPMLAIWAIPKASPMEQFKPPKKENKMSTNFSQFDLLIVP